jgi:hypothetical protein
LDLPAPVLGRPEAAHASVVPPNPGFDRFALDEVRRPDLGDNPKSKDSPTI